MEPTIAIGNYVQIKDQASIGQVVRISQQKKVLVTVGSLRLYLPLEAVEVVAPPSAQKVTTKQSSFAINWPSRQIEPTLDLHGLNKAQALLALEKFLDRSLLSGHDRLKVIHGQGMGILRSAIRGYLADHPLVKAVIVQSPIHCMEGMTIVEI